MGTEDQFTANLANAVGSVGKPPKPTKGPVVRGKGALATEVNEPGDGVQLQPPQPGSPCQVKGCLGRYSILQTTKDLQQKLRIRLLICRTCNHQPNEPHKSPL